MVQNLRENNSLRLKPIDYRILIYLNFAPEGRLSIYKLSKKIQRNGNIVSYIKRRVIKLKRLGFVNLEKMHHGKRVTTYAIITEAGRNILFEAPPLRARDIKDIVKQTLEKHNFRYKEVFAVEGIGRFECNFIVENQIAISIRDGFRRFSKAALEILRDMAKSGTSDKSSPLLISKQLPIEEYQADIRENKKLIAGLLTYLPELKGIVIFSGSHPEILYKQLIEIPTTKSTSEEETKRYFSEEDTRDEIKTFDGYVKLLRATVKEAKQIVANMPADKYRFIFVTGMPLSKFENILIRTIQDLLE